VARVARAKILYDGCYAHVISRSIGKQKIFNDPEDFEVFRELLIKVKFLGLNKLNKQKSTNKEGR